MKNYIAFENNEEGNVWTSEYILSIKWKKSSWKIMNTFFIHTIKMIVILMINIFNTQEKYCSLCIKLEWSICFQVILYNTCI